jgi:hypothetical protein
MPYKTPLPGVRIVLRLLMIAIPAMLGQLAWPLYACGCGVYIPRENNEGGVLQERALIRWDGVTEEIIMELDVRGEASEAAWILPVPARAEVKLGDPELFGALYEWTRPTIEQRRRHVIPGFGGGTEGAMVGALPVTVFERLDLGPFDVSNLAASDAGALAGWLDANGYSFPPALADVVQPYVEQNWFFVAVRLQAASAEQALTGALPPIGVRFPSNQLIYPMRATALAPGELPVTLYILAEHRVNKVTSFGATRLSFADWIDPASLPADSPLRSVVEQRQFLTKFEDVVEPGRVDGDYVFLNAAQDTPYREVIVRYTDDYTLFYVLVCGVPLLFGLLLAFGIYHYLRRRQAPAATA